MQPEQQQRILGYFLEEAREHLNTIEQGLLNLQITLKIPKIIIKAFLPANPTKVGRPILGLIRIQQPSNRLRNAFRFLRSLPFQ